MAVGESFLPLLGVASLDPFPLLAEREFRGVCCPFWAAPAFGMAPGEPVAFGFPLAPLPLPVLCAPAWSSSFGASLATKVSPPAALFLLREAAGMGALRA